MLLALKTEAGPRAKDWRVPLEKTRRQLLPELQNWACDPWSSDSCPGCSCYCWGDMSQWLQETKVPAHTPTLPPCLQPGPSLALELVVWSGGQDLSC